MTTVKCFCLSCQHNDDEEGCTEDDIIINGHGECDNWIGRVSDL